MYVLDLKFLMLSISIFKRDPNKALISLYLYLNSEKSVLNPVAYLDLKKNNNASPMYTLRKE